MSHLNKVARKSHVTGAVDEIRQGMSCYRAWAEEFGLTAQQLKSVFPDPDGALARDFAGQALDLPEWPPTRRAVQVFANQDLATHEELQAFCEALAMHPDDVLADRDRILNPVEMQVMLDWARDPKQRPDSHGKAWQRLSDQISLVGSLELQSSAVPGPLEHIQIFLSRYDQAMPGTGEPLQDRKVLFRRAAAHRGELQRQMSEFNQDSRAVGEKFKSVGDFLFGPEEETKWFSSYSNILGRIAPDHLKEKDADKIWALVKHDVLHHAWHDIGIRENLTKVWSRSSDIRFWCPPLGRSVNLQEGLEKFCDLAQISMQRIASGPRYHRALEGFDQLWNNREFFNAQVAKLSLSHHGLIPPTDPTLPLIHNRIA